MLRSSATRSATNVRRGCVTDSSNKITAIRVGFWRVWVYRIALLIRFPVSHLRNKHPHYKKIRATRALHTLEKVHSHIKEGAPVESGFIGFHSQSPRTSYQSEHRTFGRHGRFARQLQGVAYSGSSELPAAPHQNLRASFILGSPSGGLWLRSKAGALFGAPFIPPIWHLVFGL